MDKIRIWWRRHRPTTRRLAQLYAAMLYNAHVKGFFEGKIYTGPAKAACVPGLNCYSCPGAIGACPLGALQNAVAASASRPAFYVAGMLMLFGLTLGRVICGWLCPVGLVQELLHRLPTPKLKKSRLTRALSFVKYAVLAVFAVLIPLYYALRRVPLPAFCKYICPAGTLEGAVGLLSNPVNADKFGMLGALFTSKFTIMVGIFAACAFAYRAFCRFLCPLGAIYGLFARIALVGVRVDEASCTGCGACERACPVDIRRVGDRECVHCGLCVGVCPEKAIALKAGKIVLKGPETGKRRRGEMAPRRLSRALWGLALAALCAALIAFNQPDAALPQAEAASPMEEYASDAPPGHEVGEQLPPFTIEQTDGALFSLAEHRGQVVVINLWATWCTPCVNELPHFDRLQAAHPDDVAVLAIHTDFITDDPVQYLAGVDYDIPFAIDQDGGVVASLGGSTMLPQTVVVDRRGVVTYNKVGSLTYEALEELVAGAKGE